MGSVKIFLHKRENKDGTCPLTLRIIKDRKSSYIFLGQSILPEYWDEKNQRVKKSHPNSARLNNLLLKKVSEGNDKLLELEVEKGDVSSKAVKRGLKPTASAYFFKQADVYLDNLKLSGKYNRESADRPRVNRFKEFMNNENITFQFIDVPLLNKFKVYLKAERNISERTIVNHLVVIRTIFSQAISAQVVDAKFYPFGKTKIRIRFPETNKIGLTAEEVSTLENLVLPEKSTLNHYRNLWLFSFYFAGMRVSDLLRLKWSDIQNERLHYSMGKNKKAGSLKIPDKALKIMQYYADRKRSKSDVIFPELKNVDLTNGYLTQKKISYSVRTINENLNKLANEAELSKPLTMHIARHTFGNLSGDRIPVQMLQKLYRHSSITTTIGYQGNFIHRDADDALESVLKLV